MRIMEFTGSLWLDEHWHQSFKKSAKVRRYWVQGSRSTRTLASGDKVRNYKIQLGPFTVNVALKFVFRSAE